MHRFTVWSLFPAEPKILVGLFEAGQRSAELYIAANCQEEATIIEVI